MKDEFQPGSNQTVLRNHLGITTIVDCESVETRLLTIAMIDYHRIVSNQTVFNAKLIQEMHRHWLSKLYPMAGTYRSVNVSKNDFLFCPAQNISTEMGRFEREFLQVLTPCSAGGLTEKVALVHGELILIHPFREGNGRLARWIADLMVAQAGLAKPVYQLGEPDKRTEYYTALRRAFIGDVTNLTKLFARWIEDGQSRSA